MEDQVYEQYQAQQTAFFNWLNHYRSHKCCDLLSKDFCVDGHILQQEYLKAYMQFERLKEAL